MQDFIYAQKVFANHLQWAGLLEREKNVGKVLLELGPGESLFSTLLAKAYGFSRVILVDVKAFALPDLGEYQGFAQQIASQGLDCPPITDCTTIENMLSVLNAQYLTDGLDSLRRLPGNSVDFIFSQAVLEHIRKNEFTETVREIWRILKPGGISTHEIDFKDHLEASINNLRFSDHIWEAEWMASSVFYTNRILMGEMLEIFKKQGFETSVVEKKEWATIPINKDRLHPRFRAMPESDLKTSVAIIHLYKRYNDF